MKRLFTLRDSQTGNLWKEHGVVPYFDNKMVAKAIRDELNCAREFQRTDQPTTDRYRVALGPDHWRYTK
jgi:hypothetical protein